MSDTYDITIRGRLTDPYGDTVACPTCHLDEELTIYGPVGGAGTLMCPRGHQFPVPSSMDPRELLAQAAAHPDTELL